ncbi:hypothetical protein CCR75_006802 [Bremia lactucae]|uniref:Uncharacterized protein n=1 Tax=Bremia lactucae TaxID=4779 RepID=A0A976FLH8_BRELC|nr:hypothetical protein CCR75_006802 [Bremia lactucae]
MQDAIKKKLDQRVIEGETPTAKRVRLSPPMLPQLSKMPVSSSLPPLLPLRTVSVSTSVKDSLGHLTASVTVKRSAQELLDLRRKYLGDIVMVIQELKVVLTYGPGSAYFDAPVQPSVVLKLVRTVQTLEKLRALLVMDPSRLRRVSLAQLDTVEQQIKTNLLPLATLLRSFDNEAYCECAVPVGGSNVKIVQGYNYDCDTETMLSPSRATVTPLRRHDWHFLSIALSLQL